MKDMMGNDLFVGNKVALYLSHEKMALVIATIVGIKEGGISLATPNAGPLPPQVRVMFDLTMSGMPGLRVMPGMAKIIAPDADPLMERVIKELERGTN